MNRKMSKLLLALLVAGGAFLQSCTFELDGWNMGYESVEGGVRYWLST
jgi:hypothetical protein